MEIKDLVGAGEAVTRLTEIVKDVIGVVLRPTEHRLLAASRKSEAMSAVDAVHLAERKGVQLAFEDGKYSAKRLPVEDRLATRVHHEEIVRQTNIESIASVAFQQLENRSINTENRPAPDWTVRYFESAKFVSDEQMQLFWGKLLAEEVMQPGSFSLRTLNILSHMSSAEARLFSSLARQVISEANTHFIVQSAPFLRAGRELQFDKRWVLEDIGLIREQVSVDLEGKEATHISIRIGDRPFVIKKPTGWALPHFVAIALTTSGIELAALIDRAHSQEHEDSLRGEICANEAVVLEAIAS